MGDCAVARTKRLKRQHMMVFCMRVLHKLDQSELDCESAPKHAPFDVM
ncbi:hypothetical protein GCM10007858_53020 [Bradyrhizobium liaoningense]|nr:hypothetical protein GCM10007858_53020 [Bradyrhizobium liaoningense]